MAASPFKRVLGLGEVEAADRTAIRGAEQRRARFQAAGWTWVEKSLAVRPMERAGGASLQNVPRQATAISLFKRVFDLAFLDALRQAHNVIPPVSCHILR